MKKYLLMFIGLFCSIVVAAGHEGHNRGTAEEPHYNWSTDDDNVGTVTTSIGNLSVTHGSQQSGNYPSNLSTADQYSGWANNQYSDWPNSQHYGYTNYSDNGGTWYNYNNWANQQNRGTGYSPQYDNNSQYNFGYPGQNNGGSLSTGQYPLNYGSQQLHGNRPTIHTFRRYAGFRDRTFTSNRAHNAYKPHFGSYKKDNRRSRSHYNGPKKRNFKSRRNRRNSTGQYEYGRQRATRGHRYGYKSRACETVRGTKKQ